MTGRIDKIETTSDGDLFIEGVLDDGTIDSDGQRLDPEWLHSAALDWLRAGGSINTAPYNPVGVATGITRDGGTTRIRARIFDADGKAGVAAGACISIGIAQPAIVMDETAPGGCVTSGKLLSVWLARSNAKAPA